MKRFLDRKDMLSVLRKPFPEHSIVSSPYTVPLLMYTLGDYDGAKGFVERFITMYEHDPMNTGLVSQYKKFASNFLPLLKLKH
ncbi:MAG TPA: hypothetical protein VN664_08700 [Burkholderiales bacterium]|jgi:hypothetical protein|nr:hypothetical protein [Burkholderiales bacterium]